MATLKFIRLWIGSQWRLDRSWDVGTERGERVIDLAKAFSMYISRCLWHVYSSFSTCNSPVHCTTALQQTSCHANKHLVQFVQCFKYGTQLDNFCQILLKVCHFWLSLLYFSSAVTLIILVNVLCMNKYHENHQKTPKFLPKNNFQFQL